MIDTITSSSALLNIGPFLLTANSIVAEILGVSGFLCLQLDGPYPLLSKKIDTRIKVIFYR